MLLCLLLLPAAAFADKKDDDYKKAQAALNAGNVADAKKYYCMVADEDGAYKDAKMNCAIYTNEIKKEMQRNEDRFQEGVRAFQAKDWNTAGQKFRNITPTGPHYDEAREYVNKRIADAIAADSAAQDQESAWAQKFRDGSDAYNRNDFGGASNALNQVNGSRKGDAQALLAKVKSYQQAYGEGQSLENARNYKAAQASYTEAANIKGDGPGDPRAKANQMVSLINQPGNPVSPNPTNPNPVNPSHTVVAVNDTRPKVEVAKVLKEAEAAKAKGDYALARQKYAIVLSEEPRNPQALAGKASLPTATPPTGGGETSTTASAGSEVDVILAKAIGEFYSGKYEDSEVHIQDYIDVNGSKSAMGYFFRGASKLTRFFLGGESQNDRKLYADAQEAFRRAKKNPNFKPPSEKYISPRILKVYKETS